jgi:hypothetical protein
MRDASSHTYHLFSYFFLSPPAYPGEREAGYGAGGQSYQKNGRA